MFKKRITARLKKYLLNKSLFYSVCRGYGWTAVRKGRKGGRRGDRPG